MRKEITLINEDDDRVTIETLSDGKHLLLKIGDMQVKLNQKECSSLRAEIEYCEDELESE
jgi:hypothetical protein